MALAQLFYLREAIRRQARSLRHRWARRHVPPQRSFMLEPLEGRLLLAADLTGVVAAHTLLDPSVPTNLEAATIRVLNHGTTATNQVSQVSVYASLDNALDAGDVLLGTANAPKTIGAGQFKDLNVALQMPDTLAAGTYKLLARVDATNVLVEGTAGEANNLTVGPQFQVAWQFGNVPGRSGNTTLSLKDADGTRVTFSLNGPGLGEVIKDGSNWDVTVTGTNVSSAVTITTNSAGNGRVVLNDVHVLGPLASFTAATTDLIGTLAIDGPVTIPGLFPGTITLGSMQGGTVAIPSVEALTILGSVTNATFYIGTTLGLDGQPGGIGADADSYGVGSIGLFTVTGAMTSTTVRVGIHPGDGIYGDGNDTLIGGTASSIGGIIIGGTLSADSRIIAGALPTSALINGRLVSNLASDPRFMSTDVTAPALTASLVQDTGSSSIDGLTNTPTITGSLTDAGGIATFNAGFGAMPTFNVLADRQANGSFTLTRARLEEINGGPLTDGTYVLKLVATDIQGNPAQTTVSFTLDTAAPTVTVDLAPAFDTLPMGDQTTTADLVNLIGLTEPLAVVVLVEAHQQTTADASGAFTFANVALNVGANAFTVLATDRAGNQTTASRTITRLAAGNTVPVLIPVGNRTVNEGQLLTFTVDSTDPDSGQTLTYSAANLPVDAAFNPDTRVFTWTPTESQGPGSYTGILFSVTDGFATVTETIAITVNEVNAAPTLNPIGARTVDEGQQLTINVTAQDPDGPSPTTLAFSLENGINGQVPLGAAMATGTGQFSWTPTETQGPGTYTFDVVVTDNGTPALSARETITIAVSEVNQAPSLQAISNQTITAGQVLTFTAVGADADMPADTLTYSLDLTLLPPGFGLLNTPTIDPVSGVFAWTPAEGQVGTHQITVRVTDNGTGLLFAQQPVQLTVATGNHAPVLNPIAAQTAIQGQPLSFTATASDLDPGQSLTFSLEGTVPTGASMNPTTGVFTWAPDAAQVGSLSVTVRVTDNGINPLFDEQPVTVTVQTDTDLDGLPDTEEAGGPNGGDANSDGIPDGQQANVVSVLNGASQYVTLVAPAGAIFTGVQALGNPSPDDAPAGVTFPLGLVGFQLAGLVGGAATVDLILPAGTAANTYWKYGATPDNATAHWYEFLYDGTTGAEINSNVITLHLQDGERGDSDLAVNGTIVDPSGPGFVMNHAPAGTDKTITINEDTPYTFTLEDFGFTDPLDSQADHFQAVTITTLPAAGTLTRNGSPVNAGEAIPIVPAGVTWTARAAGLESTGGVASSADGMKLVAWLDNTVTGATLYTSTDAGLTWTARLPLNGGLNTVASSADGTRLVAAVRAGQLYTSTDSGVTWTARESNRQWAAVASSADGTHLVAGAQGGHLYTSTDAGVTWTARGSIQSWQSVASSADGTRLVAAALNGQLYTSTNAGLSWTARESNRGWIGVASSADGMRLVAAASGGQLYTSVNAGLTWTARESNRDWYAVASSADGTRQVATVFNGQLYTSTDSGVTWTAGGINRQWMAVASSADGTRLVASGSNINPSSGGSELYTSVASLGLAFTPAVNGNGAPYTGFTFQVQDDGGTLNSGVDLDLSANRITINVTAVNDAPVNMVPGAQTTLEDTALLFTAANGNLIRVNDVDMDILTVTLAVSNGTLTVSGASGLTGLAGNGTGTVRFGGTSADLNAALTGLSYLPALNFNSSDVLTLSTTDGMAAPVLNTVALTVTPANDAPVNVVPGAQATLVDQALVFTTANGNLISVNDAATATLAVTLSVSNGTLTVSEVAGLRSLAGNGTGIVSFGGTVTDLNAALTGLSYLPALQFFGSDTLTLTTTGGVGAPVSSTVAIVVARVNHAPAGTDKTITINEDTPYTLTAADFGFSDPNDTPANILKAVTITTLPNAGTLTLNGTPVNAGDSIAISQAGDTWTARESNRVWSDIASSADGMKLVAAEYLGQLYTSTNAGVTWTARESNRTWWSVASSADGTMLVAAAEGGQLYTSTDAGVAWTARAVAAAWKSVASSADGTKLVAVAGDALHGELVTTSVDAGVTWTTRIFGQVRTWSDVASSADGTKLVAATLPGPLYTSADSGVTWTARASNQNWLSVASSADGTKLVAAADDQLYTSTDSGLTWTARESSRNWTAVASSADGTKLVATVRDGQLYISTDAGVTWTARESSRNWTEVASSADGTHLVAGVIRGQLYTSVGLLGPVFTPALNANGSPYTSFTFQVQDDGGPLNGGADLDPSPNTITINVTALVDHVVPGAQTTLEDQALVFSTTNGNLISLNDVDTAIVTVTLAVTNGSLTLSGTTGLTGPVGNGTGTVTFGGTIADINAALNGLNFLPTPNFNGSDTLTLTTADGVATPVRSTVALTITSVNDAPSGTDQTITTPADTAYTFTLADFGFSDPNDSPANIFQAVTITSLPDAGTLTLNGTLVNVGDSIPISPAGETWTARGSGQHVWMAVASSADGMKLVATSTPATFNTDGQIYTSTDAGVTWTARESDRGWRGVASSADGMKLVAAELGGHLYTSTDAGVTWTARAGNANWWGVASSADGMKLVAAFMDTGTSNGLIRGQIYTSTDAGVTWTLRTGNQNFIAVASSADGTKLVAAADGGRLYTSTDSGVTWTAREEARRWNAVASSADGTKLIAAAPNDRVYTSTDSGLTWTAHLGPHQWVSVASSANGTTLIAGNYSELWVSTDAGVTWTDRAQGTPFWTGAASSADGTKLIAASQGGFLFTSDDSLGLVFTPDFTPNASLNTSFTFQVQDDGGPLNGGADLDPSVNTMTINMTAVVNYAPVNVVPGAQTTLEDQALVLSTANGNLISVTDVDTATVTVTLVVTHGALTLSGITGLTGLIGNGTGTVTFGGTLADINAALNGLSFLPTLNFNGIETLTLTTADGVAAPVLGTVALTVTSVNDAPSGTDKTITTSGNTAYTFMLEDFGFSDLNDRPANTLQAVTITTVPGDGTLTLNGTLVNAGDSVTIPQVGGTWTALTMPSLSQYQSWQGIASSADGTKLVAAAVGVGLYTSTDAGVTWTARTFVSSSTEGWSRIASSADGTHLVAAVIGGPLYTSTDSGVTWIARTSSRDWRDVASSADGTHLAASSYGGGLYTSTDAGVTWTARIDGGYWFSIASSADGTHLVAANYLDRGFLYTSTDAGVNWAPRPTPILSQGQQWVAVASSADGRTLVAAAWGGFLYTSMDAGVNWTPCLSSNHYWTSVASSADGRTLVATAADGLYVSTNAGLTWTGRETNKSWNTVALSADGLRLIANAGGSQLYRSDASIGLVFTPALNASGTPYTSFTFQVQDDDDTLNGGANLDPMANRITINVTA